VITRQEIVSPERCIVCHNLRRDAKDALLKEQSPLPESPFCTRCFHSLDPYLRENLAWRRRAALAMENFCESRQTLNDELSGVIEMCSGYLQQALAVFGPRDCDTLSNGPRDMTQSIPGTQGIVVDPTHPFAAPPPPRTE